MEIPELLQKILLGSMAVTGILCAAVFFFEPVRNVLVWNPVGETLTRWFAYAVALFAVLGLLCIFWKAVRMPTLIALGFYFMLFLISIVVGKMFESVDYDRHRNDTPQARYCTIVRKHESDTNKGTTYYLDIRFDDEDKVWEFLNTDVPMPFYDQVRQDDRARAQCIHGILGMTYIVSLKRTEEE